MIQGHFDCIAGRDVCGWAWRPGSPQEKVRIIIQIDGQRVADGMAATHRPDLEAAGVGSGHHAFFIPLPDSHLDGREATLLVTTETGDILLGTPAVVRLPNLVFQPAPPPTTTLKWTLALCGIVKDEAPYLLEWIAHHRLVGFEHFVLFDNASSDGTTEILSRLAKAGIVDHVPWPDIPGVGAQRPAYIAGLARLDGRARWVAFLDSDEFLTPLRDESVPDILADFQDAAGLMVPWRLFGSNGHINQDDDLVIRRFLRRARSGHPLNNAVKTIVQSHLIRMPDIHTPQLTAGSLVDEMRRTGGSQGHPDRHSVPDAQRLVVNHYFTKSRAEWQQKRDRGRATEPVGTPGWLRPDDHFNSHDLNDVEDLTLAARAPAIEAEMQRLKELIQWP